jgi:Na+/proline symporter
MTPTSGLRTARGGFRVLYIGGSVAVALGVFDFVLAALGGSVLLWFVSAALVLAGGVQLAAAFLGSRKYRANGSNHIARRRP